MSLLRILSVWALWLIIAPKCLLPAQNGYQLKTYTTENGLSHNVIYSIAQDKTGFLWLATWDGLSRFDGHEFRNYQHNPDDPGSIPFFIPSKVITDRQNYVWTICGGRPVFMYDRANDNFRPALPGAFRDAPASDAVIGPDENVWITFDTVLCRYDHEKAELRLFRIVSDDLNVGIRGLSPSMAFDNLGRPWLFYKFENDYRVFRGEISGDSIVCGYEASLPYRHYSSTPIRNEQLNPEIHVSASGNVFLFCKYGLFRCDTVTNEYKPAKNIDGSEFRGRPFFLWTDEQAGINILNTATGKLINLPAPDGEYVECIYAGRDGIIWSGNISQSREGLGLNRYKEQPGYFNHFLTGLTDDGSAPLIFPILRDRKGELWIGTRYQNYLHRIKPDGKETKFYLPPQKPGGKSPFIKCMAEGDDGIWFGTTDDRLVHYRHETGIAVQAFPEPGTAVPVVTGIHNIVIDGKTLVINGSEGIFRFDPEKNSMVKGYNHDPTGTGFSLVKDGCSGFWLGTWGSRVIRLDSGLRKTGEFTIGEGRNIVEHICPGDSNDIWVALMGGGLGRLFPETGRTELFTTADGLSNNVTYSILKDKGGCLWISTNQGISMFNSVTRLFRNYGKAEGLLITEFNSDSFFRTPEGELFFGGIGGVVGFHPDSIAASHEDNDYRSIAITDFRVSGIERLFAAAPYETDTFRLRKDDNNFQASFALFDFTSPERTRFRYRLSGDDAGWIVTDHRSRTISYANLTHRDYRLEIEATNGKGEWAYNRSVIISVPHGVLEHPLVRIALLLLFVAPLAFAGIIYVKQQKLKERQMQDRLRLESLRSQMNPHFVFNSLSSINYFISRADKLAANEYIADFSRLIRSIIDNLGDDYIPLEKELNSLHDYLKLEHLRLGDQFSYTVSSDKINSPEEVRVFPGMIQPFVENAIWHGVRNLRERTGHVKVELTRTGPERLKCIIEDDGIGRKLAEALRNRPSEHRSRGIDLVTERLRIFNNMTKSDCRVVIEDIWPDREETGTRVIIDLPARIDTSR